MSSSVLVYCLCSLLNASQLVTAYLRPVTMFIQGVLGEGLYACHPLFSIGTLGTSLNIVNEYGEIHNNIEHFVDCKENICI